MKMARGCAARGKEQEVMIAKSNEAKRKGAAGCLRGLAQSRMREENKDHPPMMLVCFFFR